MFAGRALVRVARYTDLHHAAEWIETKGLHAFQSLDLKNMDMLNKDICEMEKTWKEMDLWKSLYAEELRARAKGRKGDSQFF